jgi:hypothetical protein
LNSAHNFLLFSRNDVEDDQGGDLAALTSLLKEIYPGTKWCGFNNIANDVYSELGMSYHLPHPPPPPSVRVTRTPSHAFNFKIMLEHSANV